MKNYFEKLVMLFLVLLVISGCNAPTQVDNLSKKEVIIDTDMGYDDWIAVLFLLRSDDIIVKGITINCTGLTYCPQGALNASKLLSFVVDEKPQYLNMPIHYGDIPADTLNYVYPKIIRDSVTIMHATGFKDIKPVGIYQDGAGQFIYDTLVDAASEGKKLHFISIGTSTNFAKAIDIAKDKDKLILFKKGLAMYYKGGGAFGEIKNNTVTNDNIEGNINIPNFNISVNTQAEWNIYPDAVSHQIVIQNNISQTFIPLNLTKCAHMTKKSWEYLDKNAISQSAKFVAAIVYEMGDLQNWEGLDYWDPAVVFAILYPDEVKTSFSNVPICVDTTSDLESHGATYVDIENKCLDLDEKTSIVNIYYELKSLDNFYSTLLEVLN